MLSRKKGTAASFISILIFVACCGIMVADFNLWWLPICALPLVILCNINFKGNWDSEALDREVEKEQDEEPYSRTWPFTELEETPANSPRQQLNQKEIRKERKEFERSQENARLSEIRAQAVSGTQSAEMDRDLRRERKAIERVQEEAAKEHLREEYRG